MKSTLIIGKGDSDYTNRNPRRLTLQAKRAGHDVQWVDYDEISKIKEFKNDIVNVMLFFPYKFWNENCEKEDGTLYGTSKEKYMLFKDFFTEKDEEIRQVLKNKEINYIIHPEYAPIDRDKKLTHKTLTNAGIPTTERVKYTDLEDLLEQLESYNGIFIKANYGAEGKGITILRKNEWKTNYKVTENGLANYGIHDKWYFTDITGKKELLEQLIYSEVIVEREIITPKIKKEPINSNKFDMRLYVLANEVPHFFIRVNERDKETTNYSQGARVIHHPHTNLPEEKIKKYMEIAVKAAEAMHLNFVGIDLMFDQTLNNPVVVEAQCFTDFPDINACYLQKEMINNSKIFK